MELATLVLVLAIAIAIGIALAPFVLPVIGMALVILIVVALVGGAVASFDGLIARLADGLDAASTRLVEWLDAHRQALRHPARENIALLLGSDAPPLIEIGIWIVSTIVVLFLGAMVVARYERLLLGTDFLILLVPVLWVALTVAFRRTAPARVQKLVAILGTHLGLALLVGLPFLIVGVNYPQLESGVWKAYVAALPFVTRIKYSTDVCRIRRKVNEAKERAE